jgi:flavin reductase (DIM6/NTAB) family NADH-FMN oxidoreductase RutF
MVSVKDFWTWVGQRPIGATIVAVDGRDGPVGFLGLSATHVSADPPRFAVSVGRSTSALPEILAQQRFAGSFLPADAGDLVSIFAGQQGISGADRFRAGEWTSLVTGAPVHIGAVGAVDCRLEKEIDLGNTVMLIGSVVGGKTREDAEPLVLRHGRAWPP